MSARLGLGAFLMGVLSAFLALSLLWAVDARRELTFGIPGDIRVLRMVQAPQSVDEAAAATAQQRLLAFLREQSVVLVVTTPGDGPPKLSVFDPGSELGWLPRHMAADLATSPGNAYLFTGTYSAERWAESAVTPLLPEGSKVSGVVAPPPGVAELQYVTGVTGSSFASGTFTFGALDPQQSARVVGLLGGAGLAAQSIQRVPLDEYLAQNPLLILTAAFVGLGLACLVLSWVLFLRGRDREFTIRWRHGARGRSLVAQNVRYGVPGLAVGTVLGVAVSAAVVAAVGQEGVAGRDVRVLTVAAAAALGIVIAAWSATLCATTLVLARLRRAA